jgi:lipopolysaccharide biosynthesis glycosyltransferase
MNVVCASDERFLPHTATMLCSLLETNKVGCVYYLHNGIAEQELLKLREFVHAYGSEFEAYSVNSALLPSLKVDGHASIANYYRLLIPDLLPDDIDKVLYLDSDLLVCESLEGLWATDIDDYAIAAVATPYSMGYLHIGTSYESKYFNSGVMLMNLAKWRQEQIHRKVIDFIHGNPERIRFWDQDGLNVVLADSWLEVDPRWNVTHDLFIEEYKKSKYANVLAHPAIVHFSGKSQKPWQPSSKHPYKAAYESYRRKTPWKEGARDRLSKALWRGRRKLGSLTSRIVYLSANNDLLWKGLSRLIRFPDRLSKQRQRIVNQRKHDASKKYVDGELKKLTPDLVVLDGPFKGLKYASLAAVGSTLAPKLLGTYEAELHPTIDAICRAEYDVIVDVGCAEGYYAVGLAMRMPKTKIYAFDIDPQARQHCRTMAELNGVSDRVIIDELFDEETLATIEVERRGLIISDCEGYERFLFHKDAKTWSYLHNFDLLVEVHEFLQPGISEYLYAVFSERYNINVILSIGDILRPRRFTNAAIEKIAYDDRMKLMAELRPAAMEWFYMSSK